MEFSFQNRLVCRGKEAIGILSPMRVIGILAPLTLLMASSACGQSADAMQTVRGKHIVLKADVGSGESGSGESLSELVRSFDAAVPQWERFWELPPGTLDDWRVDAFVMNDPERFRAIGDLPQGLDFPFGYATSGNIWVIRQQSDYYTRHLLLHEGVHALAIDQFGGTGPSWFAEGFAELLGVHRGSGDQIEVNVVPSSRDAAPYWGRFKRLDQRRAEHRIPTLDAVLRYPPDLKSDVELYGWSWVAAMLLTQYPDSRDEILVSTTNQTASRAGFSERLRRRLNPQWPIIAARWRMLVQTIDYGFDWSREKIDLSMKDPLWSGRSIKTFVDAGRGWQSVGVRFAPGTSLILSPSGRCTINDDPKPWISEPPGVTIHYAGGRPLGQLLVCVCPNRTDEQRQLAPPEIRSVASETEIVIDKHCWLLFRINDHLDSLGNNRGGYSVAIRR